MKGKEQKNAAVNDWKAGEGLIGFKLNHFFCLGR